MRILYNARIHTNYAAAPDVTAVAIERDRFVAVGSDAEILSSFGSFSQKMDLKGSTVWPGLTDGHLHLEHYAVSLAMIDCETATRAECLHRVAQRTASVAAGAWIRGHGWNQNAWAEGFGSAADLDALTGDHPAYLTAKSLHAGWANSAALRIAGITATTPDPPDGKIVRDALGNPTGILLEAAMGLIQNVIPPLSVDDLAKLLLIAQQNLWKLGITGVHDFDQARCFSALQMLDQSGALRLRVVKSIPYDLLEEAIALGLRSGFGSDFLRIGSVKLFSDGALGPHTAAMLQPYEDDSHNSGLLFLDGEQIYEAGQKATKAGISMAIHAIGDRANHEVLNAYTQLRLFEKNHTLAPLRHRIEHVQILHPEDYNRLERLAVIASVQPLHATSDMYMADRYWGKRSEGAYAYRTLIENGTRMVLGSDAPVESPNPFWGIHAAVTRRRMDGSPGDEGWYPQQRLSLQAALQGYTLGPAYAAGLENSLGQIAPGFFADCILLSEDPARIPPQELHRLSPSAVMVAGDWVVERA